MRDLVERYTEAIRTQLPSLRVHAVRLNRDGVPNDVVVANNELVFRFAKTEQAPRSWTMNGACYRSSNAT